MFCTAHGQRLDTTLQSWSGRSPGGWVRVSKISTEYLPRISAWNGTEDLYLLHGLNVLGDLE